jgi:hypothetical protein
MYTEALLDSMDVSDLGRLLIVAGGIFVLVGLFFALGARIPFVGRLPGDFLYQRDGLTIAFPIVTSIVISIVLTVVLNVAGRFFR